ncbi:glycine zipper domain-containing protein [Teichococcus aestuarii]|uniref:glycine zipper domain-containing protein n=1 Tax=Teichococcus aestuarii TaxID=568898 RepID=UPI00361190D6
MGPGHLSLPGRDHAAARRPPGQPLRGSRRNEHHHPASRPPRPAAAGGAGPRRLRQHEPDHAQRGRRHRRGAALGGIIGSFTGDAGFGALLGAGAGAAGGYLYDQSQQQQYQNRRPPRRY